MSPDLRLVVLFISTCYCVPNSAWQKLGEETSGEIFLPATSSYNFWYASSWALPINHDNTLPTPEAIFTPETVDDIIKVVDFCRAHKVIVTPRASGSGAYALTNGLNVEMSNFRRIRLSEDQKTISVGAGIDWGQAIAAAGKINKVVVSGAFPYIGIAGFVQGGGMGFLNSEFGLSSDNVQSFKIVLVEKGVTQEIEVDLSQHSDLFWAMQGGGGGNWGIVTEVTLKLQELRNSTNLLFLEACWSLEDFGANVLLAYSTFLRTMSNQYNDMLTLGKEGVCIFGGWNGDPEEGKRKYSELTNEGTPLQNKVTYESIFQQSLPTQEQFLTGIENSVGTYEPFSSILNHRTGNDSMGSTFTVNAFTVPAKVKLVVNSSDFVPQFSTVTRPYVFGGSSYFSNYWTRDSYLVVKNFIEKCPSSFTCSVTTHSMRGVMSRPVRTSSFGFRSSKLALGFIVLFNDFSGSRKAQELVVNVLSQIGIFGKGAYYNYMGRASVGHSRQDLYGSNFKRYVSIARKYDPEGVFTFHRGVLNF